MNIYDQTFRVLAPGEIIEDGDGAITYDFELRAVQPSGFGFTVPDRGLYFRPVTKHLQALEDSVFKAAINNTLSGHPIS